MACTRGVQLFDTIWIIHRSKANGSIEKLDMITLPWKPEQKCSSSTPPLVELNFHSGQVAVTARLDTSPDLVPDIP